jgi:hypothetical protein
MNRILLILFLFVPAAVYGQETEQVMDERFTVDTPVSIDFQKEEEPINTPKKKKPKKNVYYGIKTRKGFTKKGFGERVTYELFHYLKTSEKPQTFVRDIYWFDFTRKEIRKTSTFDPAKGVLLHGPYEKKMGEIVLEKGIYFKGTKHGRWMYYTRDSVLKDKEKFYKGWPKESTVSYYDPTTRAKMRDITPIEYGEKEGFYYMFFESGRIAVMGEYKFDRRVGDWIENYPDGKRKRIITYPKDPFDKNARPFIRVEWDTKGKEIYRNNKKVE